MEAITSKINKQFSSMDDVVLAQYLQHVKDFCQPSNAANVQQRTVRDVLGMVISILERIIGRPDDSNARKIRLTHPAIQVSVHWLNLLYMLFSPPVD